jgi:hypothetical protein
LPAIAGTEVIDQRRVAASGAAGVRAPGQFYSSWSFPGFCPLRARDREGALDICFGFRYTQFGRLKRKFTNSTIDFGLKPPFFACFDRRHGFDNASRSLIELPKLPVRNR